MASPTYPAHPANEVFVAPSAVCSRIQNPFAFQRQHLFKIKPWEKQDHTSFGVVVGPIRVQQSQITTDTKLTCSHGAEGGRTYGLLAGFGIRPYQICSFVVQEWRTRPCLQRGH